MQENYMQTKISRPYLKKKNCLELKWNILVPNKLYPLHDFIILTYNILLFINQVRRRSKFHLRLEHIRRLCRG